MIEIGFWVVPVDVTKPVWREVDENLVVERDGVVEELLKNLVVLDWMVLGVVVDAGVGVCAGGVFLMLSFLPKRFEKS